MSETMMQEILKRLDLIGAKLGEGAVFSWEVFVRQAFWVNGVLALFACLLGIALAVGAAWSAAWLFRRGQQITVKDKYSVDDVPWKAAAVMVGGAALVVGLISLFSIVDAAAHIANPNYYALMNLARLIGK